MPRALLLLLIASISGCGTTPETTSDTLGAPCDAAAECACWECVCAGIGGDPGAAQLCVDGRCPAGEAACAPVCALAKTTVAQANPGTACPANP